MLRNLVLLLTLAAGPLAMPSPATAEVPPATAAVPSVVVSIKPVHALVAGVMAGLAEPGLIVQGAASPHSYTLKPSDARLLAQARIVFWIGPVMESFLVKPLQALSGKAELVELDRAPEIHLLPARAGGTWERDDEAPATTSPLHADGHLWLDPANAKAIVRIAAARLSALDPADAAHYAANAAAVEQRIDALDARLAQRLAPVRGVPFVVFHDAYQYFDSRYGLDTVGSITVSPETLPGARRLEEIHDRIAHAGVRCVFTEPEFQPAIVQSLIGGSTTGTAVLDPEGAAIPAGPDLYFTLMDGLAKSLTDCLAKPAG